MTWENCKKCPDCCTCCRNKSKTELCALCSEGVGGFEPLSHMKFCPTSGLPLTKPRTAKPVVVIGPGRPTKKEMEDAVKKFLKEHPYI